VDTNLSAKLPLRTQQFQSKLDIQWGGMYIGDGYLYFKCFSGPVEVNTRRNIADTKKVHSYYYFEKTKNGIRIQTKRFS
jgi:hypothetical protein